MSQVLNFLTKWNPSFIESIENYIILFYIPCKTKFEIIEEFYVKKNCLLLIELGKTNFEATISFFIYFKNTFNAMICIKFRDHDLL